MPEETASEPRTERPVFYRINVATLTRLTAPRYGSITYTERNSSHVLAGPGDLLLIGPMGVNYHIEGSDNTALYLRRWDQPSIRSNESKTILVDLRGTRAVNTYKGPETTPAPPDQPRVRPRP